MNKIRTKILKAIGYLIFGLGIVNCVVAVLGESGIVVAFLSGNILGIGATIIGFSE